MTEQSPPSHRFKRPLGGVYELQHKLGTGGQATVWQAVDIRNQSQVAVKIFRPPSDDELVRIKKEADAQHRLRHHPNIIPSLYFGVEQIETDGYRGIVQQEHPFIVMLLANGLALNYRLQKGLLLPEEIVKIVTEVASAAEFAHQHGLLHRDIKPANILSHSDSRGQRTLLADFGIVADITQDLTSPATQIGTPRYMSPEQISGSSKHPTIDIYSLGMVMHEMLAGEHAFADAKQQAVILAQIERTVPLVEHSAAFQERPLAEQRIIGALQDASVKATAKNAIHRHKTMAELADDVNTIYWRKTAQPETVTIDLGATLKQSSPTLAELPIWVNPTMVTYDDFGTIPVLDSRPGKHAKKGISRRKLLAGGVATVSTVGAGLLLKETVFSGDGITETDLPIPVAKKDLEPKSRAVILRAVQPLMELLQNNPSPFDSYIVSLGSALASFTPQASESTRQWLLNRDSQQNSGGALDIAATMSTYDPDFVNGLLQKSIKDSDAKAVGALGLAIAPYKPKEALLAKRICDDLEETEYSIALTSALDPTNLQKVRDAVRDIDWQKARRLLVAIADKQPNFAGYQFIERLGDSYDSEGRMFLADALRSTNPEVLLQGVRESVGEKANYWQAMEIGFRLARSHPDEVKRYAQQVSLHSSKEMDYGDMLVLSLAPDNLAYAKDVLSTKETNPIITKWLRVIAEPENKKARKSAVDEVTNIDEKKRSSWAYALAMATLYGYKQYTG